MTFAIYPLALAIRSTNVYEERALGISENRETDAMHGLQYLKQEEGYVHLHLKEQLAVSRVITASSSRLRLRKILKYDVWFIIFAVWLSKFGLAIRR